MIQGVRRRAAPRNYSMRAGYPFLERFSTTAPFRSRNLCTGGCNVKVPFMNLKAEHQALRNELLEAWEQILNDGAFVGGPWVERFENEFAGFCEIEHAVSTGNGTDALILALAALDIGSGDEVI